MRIIFRNINKGTVKIRVENLDDLWYLSGILKKGDKVISKTERRIKSKEDSLRDKSVREVITLGLEVEDVSIETEDMLRISGRIFLGPEDIIAKDKYHTFNIQKDSVLEIIKDKWSEIEIQRLKDAEKSILRQKILVAVVDILPYFVIQKCFFMISLALLEANTISKAERREKIFFIKK